jgi:O-antigen ligase
MKAFEFWLNKLIIGLIFLLPVGMFIVRGWASAFFILLCVACFFHLINDKKVFCQLDKTDLIILFCCALPVLVEFVIQLNRTEFLISQLDGPARFLIAAPLYLWASSSREVDPMASLKWGGMIALMSIFLFTQLDKMSYLDDRLTSNFTDPIIFCVYAVSFSSFIIYGGTEKKLSGWYFCFIVVAAVLAGYIAFGSVTRAGWLQFLLMVEIALFFMLAKKNQFTAYFGVNLAILLLVLLIFLFSQPAQDRLFQVFQELERYSNGDMDTSVGIRMNLWRLDWQLFNLSPFLGFQDRVLPPYDELVRDLPWLTSVAYATKLCCGSHNQILALFVENGIFGGVTALIILVGPILFFLKKSRSPDRKKASAAVVGLVFSSGLLLAAQFTMLFGLKMTSSFHAFALAVILGAQRRLGR